MFTIAWSSLTGVGTTRDARYVFAVLRKSDISDADGTLTKVFDYLAWAFNALMAGRHPDRDHLGKRNPKAGQLIADGWRGLGIQLRGDWEFYTQVLDFPSAGDVNCCFICGAEQNGPMNCYDSSVAAGWRPTIITHDSYIANLHAMGLSLPSLFKIKSLLFDGVTIDVLHAIDQGLASHVVANTFIEVSIGWGGGTAKRNGQKN